MTYIEQARAALLKALGDSEQDWADDLAILDGYTLLLLVKGTDCTDEDIHDAWAVARQRTRPDHGDLIRFDLLMPWVQSYDRKYRDAVRVAARDMHLGGAEVGAGGGE